MLETTTDKPEYGTLKISSNGKVIFAVFIDNICYSTVNDSTVLKEEKMDDYLNCIPEEIDPDVLEQGYDPVLNSGLIPVVISDDGNITVADVNSEWYDYDNKIWANAVTVKVNTDTSVGSLLDIDNVMQMFVWIPRYNYDVDTIINAQTAIDVEFVSVSSEAHSAFTFGDEELKGLWIGKFEMSGIENRIIPNVNSSSDQETHIMFSNVTNINNTNGLDNSSDVHMIKNTEWGLVTYFSQSKYGVCNEDGTCSSKVGNNHYISGADINIITGCGASEQYIFGTCSDSERWNTSSGVMASTTNNISGIYDMASGRWEAVMAVMEDENGIVNLSNFGSIDNKYYDVYAYSDVSNDFSVSLKGDAIGEVSSGSMPLPFTEAPNRRDYYYFNSDWNNDLQVVPFLDSNWIIRGSGGDWNSYAGIYAVDVTSYNSNKWTTTRAVLAP